MTPSRRAQGVRVLSSDSRTSKHDLFMLAADGFLITAGTFAVMMGAAFGLDALGVAALGEPGGSGFGFVLSTFSWLLQVGGFVVGPAITWRLHRRRFTRFAVLGAAVGLPLSFVIVVIAILPSALLNWLVSLVSSTENLGAIVYLAAVVVGLVVMLAFLDADALRDLSPSRREHTALDVGRLVATVALAVFAAVEISLAISGTGGGEVADPGVFMIAAGVVGAAVVTAANLTERFFAHRAEVQPTTTG